MRVNQSAEITEMIQVRIYEFDWLMTRTIFILLSVICLLHIRLTYCLMKCTGQVSERTDQDNYGIPQVIQMDDESWID